MNKTYNHLDEKNQTHKQSDKKNQTYKQSDKENAAQLIRRAALLWVVKLAQ